MAIEEQPPLVRFVLRGLSNCWMDDHGCFSHLYRLNSSETGNVSVPESDVFYTLNVLLGFSKLSDQGSSLPYDIPEIFRSVARRMARLRVPCYAYGMALWAGAELQLAIPDELRSQIESYLHDNKRWSNWTGQDLGMLLSGTLAQAKHGRKEWVDHSHRLKTYLDEYYSCRQTGLFYNSPKGLRRRFASFATGVYLTLACFHYGEFFEHEPSIKRALECVQSLQKCQGPRGEWPWFYDVPSGKVLDIYPVYSVHQDGMAPAYLHHAIKHGHPGARESMLSSFYWILGENQLGCSMLAIDEGMIYRAQARNQRLQRGRRAAKAIMNCTFNHAATFTSPRNLMLTPECRSYHLGWILWSFAGKDDYKELTHHSAFIGQDYLRKVSGFTGKFKRNR